MNDQAPPKKKRTWLWVVLGIFLLCVIVGAGALFFAVSFFRQNMNVTAMSEPSAAEEFDSVRARFAGNKPLFQLVDGRPQMVSDAATQPASPAEISTIHVLAWDRDEEQLVKFSLPFWLVRLKAGPIRITSRSAFDDHALEFRAEDLERHGPGLLLDLNEQRDGRLLIWVE